MSKGPKMFFFNTRFSTALERETQVTIDIIKTSIIATFRGIINILFRILNIQQNKTHSH